jgi:hypothetical protein
MRPRSIAPFLAIALVALAPAAARAWSTQSMPTNSDGSSRFADPDEKVERLTGRGDDGSADRDRTRGSGDRGNWSFTIDQRDASSRSPFDSMFSPTWPDRRR